MNLRQQKCLGVLCGIAIELLIWVVCDMIYTGDINWIIVAVFAAQIVFTVYWVFKED